MNIVTKYICPPIPDRSQDWVAYHEGYEDFGPIGYGKTEQAAIENLRNNYDEPTAPPPSRAVFYCIEFIEFGHCRQGKWWRDCLDHEDSLSAWTSDIRQAIRYADKASAERAYALLKFSSRSHGITEHAWVRIAAPKDGAA